MAQILQFRRGTAAAATANNPVLADGEQGYETDTGRSKIGDGVTAWNSLAYMNPGPDGPAGVSVVWLGTFASAPVSPNLNEAYRDSVLKKARIWDGDSWEDMVLDGEAFDPFIVGDILMHDGTWVDNVTRVGWYACIAANSGQGCPDLENQFIKGSAPADVGDTGGSATHTLTKAQIPKHYHEIDHDHGAATTGSHAHYSGGRFNIAGIYGGLSLGSSFQRYLTSSASSSYQQDSESVSPSVNLPNYAGDSEDGTETGLNGEAHNNEPQYYKLIFIRKCS